MSGLSSSLIWTGAEYRSHGPAAFDITHPAFAASPLGVIDATAAVQAACNAAAAAGGGTVFVPKGEYRLLGYVYIPSLVAIVGSHGAVFLTKGGGFRNESYLTGVAAGEDSDIALIGITIHDISVLGDTPEQPGLIGLRFVDRLRIERCRIYQTGNNNQLYGIRIAGDIRDFIIAQNNHRLVGDFVYMLDGASESGVIGWNTVRGRRDLSLVPNGISLWGGARRVKIVGNDVREIGDEGISVQNCTDVLIGHNVVRDCDTFCIDVRGVNRRVSVMGNQVSQSNTGAALIRVALLSAGQFPYGTVVSGNIIDCAAAVGVGVYGADGTVVLGNEIESSTGTNGSGILVADAGGSSARDTDVSHNRILNAGGSGIELQGSVGTTVTHNHVTGSGISGIRTYTVAPVRATIASNICSRNGRLAAFEAGIQILVGNKVRLIGNECFDDQGVPTQATGISVFSAVTDIQIVDNDVSQGGMSLAGGATAPLVRGNRGFRTKAVGSSTVAAGATTLAVSYAGVMARDVDSVNRIRITPRGDSGTRWWITKAVSFVQGGTAGDYQFTMNLAAAAPAGGFSFGWEVDAEERNAF